MENCESEREMQVRSNKRLRDHEESESESKRIRHEPVDNSSDCKEVYSKLPELEISAEVNKIRDDILHILDEPEDVTEIQDLDSVIKSFEEEIVHSTPVTDPGELGYLLEASDDELGLPPANSPTDDKSKEQLNDLTTNSAYAFGFEKNAEFENNSFGYGEELDRNDGGNGDFATVGGLFEYSEKSDLIDFSYVAAEVFTGSIAG